MKKPVFGSSGIRCIADDELIETASRVGLIVGEIYGTVIIGGDSRVTTENLKQALFSGVKAAGATCRDAGLIPTPTLAYSARNFEAGLMVTASHNPPEYNGIKFWNSDGSAFDGEQEYQIETMLGDTRTPWPRCESIPESSYPNAVEEHIGRILLDFAGNLRGLKIVVDCGGGAGSVITPQLMRRMGAETIELYCQPAGIFPRASEPTNESLTELQNTVIRTGAQLGLAHDGDADRLVVVTADGRLISGDKLLLILADYLKVKEIVTTVDASMVVEESGLITTRTRVGDSAVSAELKRNGFGFGGEPCGAWIFPRVSYCPDGIYAAAVVASMAAVGRLARLVDEIPDYPIIRGSIPFHEAPDMGDIEAWLAELNPSGISHTDGLRAVFPDGWLLVRVSGTEPKLRLTVEARDRGSALAIYRKAERFIAPVLLANMHS